jgi:putative nucleotidyltransferase with HDIG domain
MVLKLVSYGNYLYYHAVVVSVFSVLLGRALGQFDSKTLEMIGLGGFLHDIGRTQIPQELNESVRPFTPDEWKVMKSHPKLGLDMLKATKQIPDEVRYIVYQHHEQPGGGGYPNGLRGPVIYPPARIVAICDSFSALLSARPFRKAYSVEEALKIMQAEAGKFDKVLLQTLRAVFAHRLGDSSPSQAA